MAENEHGRRVVVKHAASPVEAARLRREADLLDVAAHPGLVELASFDDGAEPVLRTVAVDGQSLDLVRPLDVEEVAGVVAALASTLADLHGMGLVHGAVTPEHVLIDGDGRPVLCGLGYGGLVGEPLSQAAPLAGEFVDQSRAGAGALDPASDVCGAGALVFHLLDRGAAGAADGLRAVARRATAADVASRPSARDLADAAYDATANPRLPRLRDAPVRAASEPGIDPLAARRRLRPLESWRRTQAPALPAPRARLRSVALLAVAIVAIAGVVATTLRSPSSGTASPAATAATAAPAEAATGAETGRLPADPRAAPPAPAGCEVAAGPLAADVDGDGCPETLRFADGVVAAGALRWSVGEAGDEIAVGDWACSGARSLAILRPRTGEVFAFTGWAGADRPVEAPMIGAVAGGRALRAADLDGDGCNELVVERAAGAPVVMRAPRLRP